MAADEPIVALAKLKPTDNLIAYACSGSNRSAKPAAGIADPHERQGAKGKPKKQAEAMVALLDDMFGEEDKPPLPEGSPSSTNGSGSSSKQPPLG